MKLKIEWKSFNFFKICDLDSVLKYYECVFVKELRIKDIAAILKIKLNG